MDLLQLAQRIHKRVQSKSFSKTDFALNLLLKKPDEWSVPTYIAEGLKWLEAEIAPPELEVAEGQEEDVEDMSVALAETDSGRVA